MSGYHYNNEKFETGCIYKLYKNDVVVYIGQAKSQAAMFNRFKSHTKDKDFDDTSFEVVKTEELNRFEADEIEKYWPKYNKMYPPAGILVSKTEINKEIKLMIDDFIAAASSNGFGVSTSMASKILPNVASELIREIGVAINNTRNKFESVKFNEEK